MASQRNLQKAGNLCAESWKIQSLCLVDIGKVGVFQVEEHKDQKPWK